MQTLTSKCVIGVALLVSIAAAPFSEDSSRPGNGETIRSAAFSTAMLDHSKSRWACEGQVRLVDTALGVRLPASPPSPGMPLGSTVGGATQCPVEHTHCPPETTVCPIINTACPVQQTVCKITECPAQTTMCPVIITACGNTSCSGGPTTCPVIPTVCPEMETLCPNEPTICYEELTTCPEEATNCPIDDTTCPQILTICMFTRCNWKTICSCTVSRHAEEIVAPRAPLVAGYTSSRVGELGDTVPAVTFLPAVAGQH